MVPPAAPTPVRAHPHDHLVGFYESDAFLTDSVARYLAPALTGGGIALVLATPAHRASFARAVQARGVDTSDGDRYVALDVDETLSAIRRDGVTDPNLFREVIGGLIDGLSAGGRRVYAFGELVALLWERDDVAGAMELETLWNELAATRPFSLFCGYPTRAFAEERDTTAFRTICDAHSAVIPSESYSELLDPAEKGRAVAILTQEAVAHDNERDALDEVRAGLQAELDQRVQSERLQRQFTAMLVHDLRSPTVIVSGLLTQLDEHWDELEPAEIREHVSAAAASASRMERLIDDMLQMARLGSGQFRYHLRELDLPATVEGVAADVRKATGRRIEVEVHGRVRPAYADLGRQQQILDNLLSNAVKFSSGDSPVRVEVEDTGAELITVHVRDRGVGIAASDLDKLFRPFSRIAQRPGGAAGTGLGLFITRALVEGQGGHVEVESMLGIGSRFSYTVPVAPAAGAPRG